MPAVRRPLLLLALLAASSTPLGCGLRDEGVDDAPIAVDEGPAQAKDAGFGSPATATRNTVRIPGEDPVDDAAGAATAVFPGTSARTRPSTVTLVDRADWRGVIAAAALAGAGLEAPILLTDDDDLPPATSAALERLAPTGAALAADAQVIRIGEVAEPDGLRVKTIPGADPYERAAQIDRFAAAVRGREAGHLVIASGDRAEYAMPAAAWAARSGNPVLFTHSDSIPEPTVEALKRHEAPDLYLLGPEPVIGREVEKQLGKIAHEVRRIDGETPVDAAIAFARYRRGTFGWGYVTPGHNYTLASSARPLDAAAAATLGSGGVFAPLLLTDRAAELPGAVESYLLDVQPGYRRDPATAVFNRVFVLGGDEAISGAAQGRLDELTELVPVSSGEGR